MEATNALILQLPPPLLALLTQVSAEESFDAGLQVWWPSLPLSFLSRLWADTASQQLPCCLLKCPDLGFI